MMVVNVAISYRDFHNYIIFNGKLGVNDLNNTIFRKEKKMLNSNKLHSNSLIGLVLI